MSLQPKFLKMAMAAIAVAVIASVAVATSMVRVNLAQIVENSEKSFLATVQSVEVVNTADGWAEKVSVVVDEPIYGTSAGETVVWFQARSGEAFRFPGMPDFHVDEQYAVFLSRKGLGTNFQAPFALGQAAFRAHRVKKTGEVILVNEFRNENLFAGLDTKALAEEIVSQDAQQRGVSMSKEERVEKVQQEQSKMMSAGGGGVSVGQLRELATTIKSIDNAATRFALPTDQAAKPMIMTTDEEAHHDH